MNTNIKADRNKRTAQRGFSLIELLIAVLIIGILSSLAVVVVSERAQDARIKAARSDMIAFREALQHVSFDTGYYFRLYALDDVSGGDDIAHSDDTGAQVGRVDGLLDEQQRNPEFQNVFISIQTGDLFNLTRATAIWDRIELNETQFNWQGAYVSWRHEVEKIETDPYDNTLIYGYPLDPWGNPYFLFTQQGFVDEREGEIIPPVGQAGDTQETITDVIGIDRLFTPRRFDRMTIISLGPDGEVGDADVLNPTDTDIGRGDDIVVQW